MAISELEVVARLHLFEARLAEKIDESKLALIRWVAGFSILQSSLLLALLLKASAA